MVSNMDGSTPFVDVGDVWGKFVLVLIGGLAIESLACSVVVDIDHIL